MSEFQLTTILLVRQLPWAVFEILWLVLIVPGGRGQGTPLYKLARYLWL